MPSYQLRVVTTRPDGSRLELDLSTDDAERFDTVFARANLDVALARPDQVTARIDEGLGFRDVITPDTVRRLLEPMEEVRQRGRPFRKVTVPMENWRRIRKLVLAVQPGLMEGFVDPLSDSSAGDGEPDEPPAVLEEVKNPT